MIHKKQITSIFGSPYKMYFRNGAPNPAGDLLVAGIGWPTKRNNWLDTRELWSYPYYYLNIMMGEGMTFYRNESGYKCELSYGHFLIGFPNIKQQSSPALGERWGEIYIGFTGAIFDAIREHDVITPQQPVWRLENPDPWIKRLQTFLEEPVPSSPQNKLHRAVCFLDYLLQMLKESEPVWSGQTEVDWFDHACNLLTKDLHHEVNLDAIADELEMSYHTFRIYFRRRAGVAPVHYRNQARLKTACHYLATTPIKTCDEISFIVGYSSVQRFSEQFKKHIGMTPLEYRKKHREDSRNSSY